MPGSGSTSLFIKENKNIAVLNFKITGLLSDITVLKIKYVCSWKK